MINASSSRRGAAAVAAVVIGSLVMAISAQIAVPVPFSPVPVTMQTLAIPLLVATLGTRGSVWALVLYLAEGAAGLPVFAPSATALPGILKMIGPTGGYLVAFPIAAFVTGWLFDRGLVKSFAGRILAVAAGTVAVFALGAGWLGHIIGANHAIAAGVTPFLIGDAYKTVLAALLVPAAQRYLGRFRIG